MLVRSGELREQLRESVGRRRRAAGAEEPLLGGLRACVQLRCSGGFLRRGPFRVAEGGPELGRTEEAKMRLEASMSAVRVLAVAMSLRPAISTARIRARTGTSQ